VKTRRLVFTVLLLFSAAVFQLAAQENEADRKSPLDIRLLPTPPHFPCAGSASEPRATTSNDAGTQYNLGIAYANGQGLYGGGQLESQSRRAELRHGSGPL
jgi:hypothetical protein